MLLLFLIDRADRYAESWWTDVRTADEIGSSSGALKRARTELLASGLVEIRSVYMGQPLPNGVITKARRNVYRVQLQALGLPAALVRAAVQPSSADAGDEIDCEPIDGIGGAAIDGIFAPAERSQIAVRRPSEGLVNSSRSSGSSDTHTEDLSAPPEGAAVAVCAIGSDPPIPIEPWLVLKHWWSCNYGNAAACDFCDFVGDVRRDPKARTRFDLVSAKLAGGASVEDVMAAIEGALADRWRGEAGQVQRRTLQVILAPDLFPTFVASGRKVRGAREAQARRQSASHERDRTGGARTEPASSGSVPIAALDALARGDFTVASAIMGDALRNDKNGRASPPVGGS